MESSAFCKVVGNVSSGANQNTKVGGNSMYPSYQMNQQTHEKLKPLLLDNKHTKDVASSSTPALRPRQKYSDAELNAMRREGVYFKCGAKWSRAHAKCARRRPYV